MMNVGRIHSFQSLGTVDGPGVRFVVFMQGCPLRCKCCHNPDTWDFSGGKEYTEETVLQRIVRFKEYFGITITDFIARSRLEKAEELLLGSNLSTDRIAQDCGFSSKNAFYRQFKEFRGMTPGDFRRQVKN